MKMLLNEKTKQEKIMNEVQKKRNLFGLGLTSLIAACAADDAAEDEVVGIGTRPTTDLTADTLAAVATATEGATINPGNGVSTVDQPMNRLDNKQDLVVIIARGDDRIDGSNVFRMEFRNGDHTTASMGSTDYSITTHQGLVPENKYSLVVASGKFGDLAGTVETGAIYIVWNIPAGEGHADAKGDSDGASTTVPKHLKVAGVAGDTISSDTPKFYQIGGDKTAGNEPADQADMVFGSTKGYNILWDVTKHAITSDAGATNLTLGTSPGILQVQGGALTAPKFTKVNSGEDYDMAVIGGSNTYILWDVANYYDATAKVEVNLAAPDTAGAVATHGLLTIAGTGEALPKFIKVNNNDGYDMIVKGSAATYILWDVANYHDAADAKAVNVNLAGTDENAAATHGLLTIKGAILGGINIMTAMDNGEIGLTDIDGNGINDLAFVYADTYILFGEKIANRDGKGKAISHSIDLNAIEISFDDAGAGPGFFSADEFLGTATATGQPADAIGYRFDSNIAQTDLDDLTKIKTEYEAAINPPADGGALSEEAYWDIA